MEFIAPTEKLASLFCAVEAICARRVRKRGAQEGCAEGCAKRGKKRRPNRWILVRARCSFLRVRERVAQRGWTEGCVTWDPAQKRHTDEEKLDKISAMAINYTP